MLTGQSENGQQRVIVCPGLLSLRNGGRNKRLKVKVCNISASTIQILVSSKSEGHSNGYLASGNTDY